MNAAQLNYLHPSVELRALAAREEAATKARVATEITVTLPSLAAIQFAEIADERWSKADKRAHDEAKDEDYREFWRARAQHWDVVGQTLRAKLRAGGVRS
jgi:hypothetical protein